MSRVSEETITSAGTGTMATWVPSAKSITSWASVRDDTSNSKATLVNNNGVGTFSSTLSIQIAYSSGTTRRTVQRQLIIIKTTDILDPPETATLDLHITSLANTNPATGNNVTKWALVKPSKEFIDANTKSSVALVGTGASNPGADTANDIDGWTAGSAWNSTLYSDIILHTSLSTGSNLITLNKQARLDMARFDCFAFWIINYTHDVLNQDPASVSGTPGGSAMYRLQIRPGHPSFPILLNYKPGKVRDAPPNIKRINKDFTLNSFADISAQRGRFVKNGAVVDQVPFLLGIKGPLSLRGRQFDDEGKPISTTVKPPNTSKS